MKYELIICARARRAESIAQKHETLMKGLATLPAPWGFLGESIPMPPDPGTELAAALNLKKSTGSHRGISYARVMYLFRGRDYPDERHHDDVIRIGFIPQRIDYHEFVFKILPIYIGSFSAYKAELGLGKSFWGTVFDEAKRTQPDWTHRTHVLRVFPISFYDALMCRNAFRLKPQQVADRLRAVAEHVDCFADGVYIVGSSKALPLEEADTLSRRLTECIRKNDPA